MMDTQFVRIIFTLGFCVYELSPDRCGSPLADYYDGGGSKLEKGRMS